MPRGVPVEPVATGRKHTRSRGLIEPAQPPPRRPYRPLPPQLARWFWLLLVLPIGYGLWLRLGAWWNTHTLTADEATVLGASSWATHGLGLQTAPPGWLWLQGVLVDLGGTDERVLHAPSLLADLAATALLVILAARLLPLAGAFTVLMLAAANQFLVLASATAGQYSFEVLGTVVLIGTAVAVRHTEDRRAMAGWWGLGAVSLLVSQAAVITVPALALALLIEMVLRSQWVGTGSRFRDLEPDFFWAALALDWLVALRPSAADSALRDAWQRLGAFPPNGGTTTAWTSQLVGHFASNPLDAAVAVAVVGRGPGCRTSAHPPPVRRPARPRPAGGRRPDHHHWHVPALGAGRSLGRAVRPPAARRGRRRRPYSRRLAGLGR
ncbi:hypothetical protein [Fodinicola feengrottensis]|uniref:hypothetical protein n=1 Tax=Fodinicola feengrottensis TaxID=435914 RepID=UPI0013CF65DB|nr:hypothetical protein [Fodinicola feengrottensis]